MKNHKNALVEIKKKKPNVKTKNEDHRTVLFIDLENLGSLARRGAATIHAERARCTLALP